MACLFLSFLSIVGVFRPEILRVTAAPLAIVLFAFVATRNSFVGPAHGSARLSG